MKRPAAWTHVMWQGKTEGSVDVIAQVPIDVEAVRRHFAFSRTRRTVTNNAASTQPPCELVDFLRELTPDYENVHRGQSAASQCTTARFEAAYETIAEFIGAPDRSTIVVTRNTTEAHNLVMYSLMTEFRSGDNVVTTMMEHNSNYVPWYGLCREILPAFGRDVDTASRASIRKPASSISPTFGR